MTAGLSPEQRALIPQYREKWRQLAFSTDRINPEQAVAAVKAAYSVNGFREPAIYICPSPYQVLQKLLELEQEFGDLGEGLNQTIQHHNRWSFETEQTNSPVDRDLHQQLREHLTQPSKDINAPIEGPLDEKLQADFARDAEEPDPEAQASMQEILGQFLDSGEQPVDVSQQAEVAELVLDREAAERMLHQAEQALGRIDSLSRGTMRDRLFYNSIAVSKMATNYCKWDFCFSVLQWPHNPEEWETSAALFKTCGWIWPFERVCVISDRPTRILMNEKGQLHAYGEAALAFSDDYCLYVHHGALQAEPFDPTADSENIADRYQAEANPRLKQALVESYAPEKLQVDWLFQENDPIVREVLYQKLGPERIQAALAAIDSFDFIPQALTEEAGSLLWVAYAILQNREAPLICEALESFQTSSKTPAPDLSQVSVALLQKALASLTVWLETSAPDCIDEFSPGLIDLEIQNRLADLPFKLPQEVNILYQWRNGSGFDSRLFVYHDFLDLDRALESFEALNEVWPEIAEPDTPQPLFPLFEFEGEYFATIGSDKAVTTSPVYYISEIFEVDLAYNSLTTMLLTLAESCQAGCYTVSDGRVEKLSDFKRWSRIRQQYNPGTRQQLYAEGG